MFLSGIDRVPEKPMSQAIQRKESPKSKAKNQRVMKAGLLHRITACARKSIRHVQLTFSSVAALVRRLLGLSFVWILHPSFKLAKFILQSRRFDLW